MRTPSMMFLAAAALPGALASSENSEEFEKLTSRAVNLMDGTYTFTNVGTGQKMIYERDGRQIYPANADASSINFTGTGDGPYTQLSVDGKCLSAQWDTDAVAKDVGADAAADAAAVLYDCADSSSSVNADKQKWLLVPAARNKSRKRHHYVKRADSCDANEQTGKDDGSVKYKVYYNTACCEKTKGWITRHPQYVKGTSIVRERITASAGETEMSSALFSFLTDHIECASLLTKDQRRAMFMQEDYDNLAKIKAKCQAGLPDGHPDKAKISKRDQATDGTFYVIALDHLDDMPTRALAGSAYEDTSDGALATTLDKWAEGASDQQWRVEIV